jgi:hypothetical protein
MTIGVFNEEQTYRGTWVIYLLILIELPTLILLLVLLFNSKDKSEMGLVLTLVLGTLGFVFLIILNLKLETRIDQSGVSFRYFPFIRSWRKYPKETIQSISVINYSPITDYGGWGFKGNKTTKAYSILGDRGLLLDVGEKKKIMIGTLKAKELEAYLINWMEA